MVSTSNRGVRIRYALFGISFVFWIVPLLVNIFLQLSDIWLVNIILHSISGFSMLVYVPAAIVFSVKNSPNKFTRTGGEIFYLIFNLVLWTASGVLAAIDAGLHTCNKSEWQGYDNAPSCEAVNIAISILSFVHALIFALWCAWIIHHVHEARVDRRNLYGSVYGVPVHKLLRADREIATELGGSGSGRASTDLRIEHGDGEGLFNGSRSRA